MGRKPKPKPEESAVSGRPDVDFPEDATEEDVAELGAVDVDAARATAENNRVRELRAKGAPKNDVRRHLSNLDYASRFDLIGAQFPGQTGNFRIYFSRKVTAPSGVVVEQSFPTLPFSMAPTWGSLVEHFQEHIWDGSTCSYDWSVRAGHEFRGTGKIEFVEDPAQMAEWEARRAIRIAKAREVSQSFGPPQQPAHAPPPQPAHQPRQFPTYEEMLEAHGFHVPGASKKKPEIVYVQPPAPAAPPPPPAGSDPMSVFMSMMAPFFQQMMASQAAQQQQQAQWLATMQERALNPPAPPVPPVAPPTQAITPPAPPKTALEHLNDTVREVNTLRDLSSRVGMVDAETAKERVRQAEEAAKLAKEAAEKVPEKPPIPFMETPFGNVPLDKEGKPNFEDKATLALINADKLGGVAMGVLTMVKEWMQTSAREAAKSQNDEIERNIRLQREQLAIEERRRQLEAMAPQLAQAPAALPPPRPQEAAPPPPAPPAPQAPPAPPAPVRPSMFAGEDPLAALRAKKKAAEAAPPATPAAPPAP